VIRDAPHGRPVRRLDEVRAAKLAIVKYGFENHPELARQPAAQGELEAQSSR
jgi:hypothetical protein